MSTRFDRIAIPLLTRIVKGQKMGFQQVSAAKQGLYVARKPPRRGTKAKAQRKAVGAAAHRESTGAIREAVFARSNGNCEFCQALATEMHHLESGSRRRSHQAVSNCVAVCFDCHRRYHRNPWDFFGRVLKWAEDWGYPVPRRFLRPAPAAAQTPLGHSGSEAGGKE